jgi:hypothetical protein
VMRFSLIKCAASLAACVAFDVFLILPDRALRPRDFILDVVVATFWGFVFGLRSESRS